MISCSEFVAQGHPDRVADSIASYLLDEYIKHDPKTRFALEVQLKDHVCNLAGEVTSTWNPTQYEIAELAREAIKKVGYTAEYAARWPKGSTLNGDIVQVNNFIGHQSPDIAQGVDREGWGDQGCLMGMASCEKNFGYMPRDRYFAHVIGQRLYKAAKANLIPIGLDIKVLVSITKGLNVEQVVIAAPMLPELEDSARRHITAIVHEVLGERHHSCDEIIINGTGTYVVHSSVGDAGVVGRKLAVDFYGLNCPIGGGTTWGKDGTKADVTLNLAARYFSLKTILEGDGKYQNVFTKLSCCIGRSECLLVQTDEVGNVIKNERINLIPSELIGMFGVRGAVRDDMFYHLCEDGLFSYVDEVAIKDANN